MLYQLLKKAESQGWAIGQFNFSNLEQLRGIGLAAKENSAPVIIGTSEKEAKFLGLEEALALVRIFENKLKIPLFLHLDHGKDLDFIKKAIDLGYDSVHFDGSFLSFKENVKLTRKIVTYAHSKKVLAEGELGYLRGESRLFSRLKPRLPKEDLTNPEAVKEFVTKTGVDSLAIAIGNIHGIYKKMPSLDFDRLQQIREQTDAFLVLHGGSGLLPRYLKKAIKSGIQKININTEIRVAWRNALERALKGSTEVKPYEILPKVTWEIKKKVEKYIKIFGSAKKL